jgi:RND family efflux transporter MFP subunit
MSDGQLLERFITGHEQAAFEELLARHGPMVLGVCQKLLRDPHDAEDAFQATFLVLVRRAGAIGKRDLLAGWLHGVAHRVAARARSQKSRRSQHERPGVEMLAAEASSPMAWDDRQPLIHEEVNRLPERYRLPVVLCYLEGKTLEQAAQDLRWTRGTVKGRLERARDLLRKRLTRRGVALSAGSVTAILSPTATALPPALVGDTLRAAVVLAAGQSAAAGAVSPQVASLIDGVLRTMLLTKLKIAGAVLLVLGLVGAGLAVSVYRSPAAEPTGDDRAAKANDAPTSDQPVKGPVAAPADSPMRKVQVTYPFWRKVVDHQEYTGRTEATTVQMTAGASGDLTKIAFAAGAMVKKGDLLFEIDPRQYQAEFAKAEAELRGAEVRWGSASRHLATQKKLWSTNATNLKEVQRAEANHQDTQAAMHVARASVELARLHLELTKVTAPLDGRIGQARVAPGTYVKAGTTLLATIVVTNPVFVSFEIDERTYVQLRRRSAQGKVKLLGASIGIQLPDEDDKPFQHRGVIDFVGNEVNPNETVRVRAVLSDADQDLLPGLFVRIRLAVSAPRQEFLVPDRAVAEFVNREATQAWLWVVTRQNTLEKRSVELGRLKDGWHIVKKGLKGSELVVVDLPVSRHPSEQGLQPGMHVQPERVKPTPPPETEDEQQQPTSPARGQIKR